MSRFVVAALLLLGAVGCTPTLTDGRYACSNADECPPGWTCWPSDQRCHANGVPLGELCESDGQCESGLCVTSPDPMSEEAHCSVECEDDFDCGALGDEGGVCYEEVCYRACEHPEDCATGQGCYVASVDPAREMTDEAMCFDLEDRRLTETDACDNPGMCAPPGLCVIADLGAPGLCTLRCTTPDTCPDGTRCMQLFGPMAAGFCLATCSTGPGMSCRESLTCGAFTGEPGQFCMPSAWVGETLPLSPQDAMTGT